VTDAAGPRGERRARAAERLARSRPGRWYFPIVGLVLPVERVDLDDATAIERVSDAPTEPELVAALAAPRLFAHLGRFAPLVAAELVVERRPGAGAAATAALAELIVTALRLRTGADAHVLVQADHPWAALPAIVDGRCAARLVADLGPARELGPAAAPTREDLEWAWAHRKPLADLLETPRVRLAVDALTTHHAETNRRLAVAKLWTGVDALLRPGDNRVRLAAAVAAMLADAAPRRRDVYRRLERLLGERRAILDGQPFGDEALAAHVGDLRTLLASLLVCFTNRGELPEGTRLDELLVWAGRTRGGE
jgi:hypothetical protein